MRFTVGREARDRYGRLLVYVWKADGRSLNGRLVAGGYAPHAHDPAQRPLRARFAAPVAQARAPGGLGLWGTARPGRRRIAKGISAKCGVVRGRAR